MTTNEPSTKLSTSPNRFSAQLARHIYNNQLHYIPIIENLKRETEMQEADPKWQKNNLEWDLRTTEWIVAKVKADNDYAQRLYATLCNNEFQQQDVWQVLKNHSWSCSWRYAGGVVANIREEGDYMDWYCSGNENTIDEEVEEDLLNLGWRVVK